MRMMESTIYGNTANDNSNESEDHDDSNDTDDSNYHQHHFSAVILITSFIISITLMINHVTVSP